MDLSGLRLNLSCVKLRSVGETPAVRIRVGIRICVGLPYSRITVLTLTGIRGPNSFDWNWISASVGNFMHLQVPLTHFPIDSVGKHLAGMLPQIATIDMPNAFLALILQLVERISISIRGCCRCSLDKVREIALIFEWRPSRVPHSHKNRRNFQMGGP